MFLFCLFFVLYLTLMAMLVSNVIVWWSIFLLMTIIFILLNKGNKSYSGIFNYFVIQETLGLLFLVFSSNYIQFIILMMKIGVAPFHFWVFSVTNSIFNYGLVWFLTMQKLPLMVVLLQLFASDMVYLFLFGLFICYLQMFMLKGYKNLLIVSSTESFNWLMLGLFFSFFNVFCLFIYYFLLFMLMVPKFSKNSSLAFFNWESTLILFNIPLSMSFFIKIFSLSEILKIDSFFVVFLLFLMFLSVLSFGYWLINLSMKDNMWLQNNNKMIYFLLMPLGMMTII
uniref:NADH dehydrogenase subunit 2 n=2 Tax=Heterorhabditis TaxID=37861 RepID=A0A306_HETBA|nr:NADH dehydrogenase subunit 2 [Heterorhabditis indica]YP_817453.1 NADH dehydrogenase subunit 2 [Heterorhabditis bacteriophora]ABJ80697.1 NADH dehydrogenase subunit 2 [Heterorhabditis bacteriophora]AZU95938.1 NADH dehydrogenase subunit 2 [Heterorhabditis bacteriophora]QAA11083.1 NADH dehydrogenase subunit 2 [Heterorhabditis indica]QAA11095.1 NADH dehydrogenase subunit 2 [Heterorhabditis bacteriophora]